MDSCNDDRLTGQLGCQVVSLLSKLNVSDGTISYTYQLDCQLFSIGRPLQYHVRIRPPRPPTIRLSGGVEPCCIPCGSSQIFGDESDL